jgi:hypothetical protein
LGAELNNFAWMPSDILSTALVELAVNGGDGTTGEENVAQVFNLVNPNTKTWQYIVPMIASSIEKHTGKHIEIIDRAEWLEQLKQTTENFTGSMIHFARTYPAIKLQDFFETHMFRTGEPLQWDVERATSASNTLNAMPAVGEEWIDRWVQGWLNGST